jgi:hypothetical protein
MMVTLKLNILFPDLTINDEDYVQTYYQNLQHIIYGV